MCNIAGYVGERRAAPILIDMLRREEGLELDRAALLYVAG